MPLTWSAGGSEILISRSGGVAGLAGKAKAQLPAGGPVQGQLTAAVTPLPPSRHVDPATGRVVPGAFPVVP